MNADTTEVRGAGPPGARVIDSCELLEMGDGNPTPIL